MSAPEGRGVRSISACRILESRGVRSISACLLLESRGAFPGYPCSESVGVRSISRTSALCCFEKMLACAALPGCPLFESVGVCAAFRARSVSRLFLM